MRRLYLFWHRLLADVVHRDIQLFAVGLAHADVGNRYKHVVVHVLDLGSVVRSDAVNGEAPELAIRRDDREHDVRSAVRLHCRRASFVVVEVANAGVLIMSDLFTEGTVNCGERSAELSPAASAYTKS